MNCWGTRAIRLFLLFLWTLLGRIQHPPSDNRRYGGCFPLKQHIALSDAPSALQPHHFYRQAEGG